MKKEILLLTLGLILVAVYFTPQLYMPPETTHETTRSTTLITPTSTTTPTSPAPKPIETTTTTTEKPQMTKPNAVYLPDIRVEVLVPQTINTTTLPLRINYTIVIRNVGNGTGTVIIWDKPYKIAPGETLRINSSLLARWAGDYTVETVINGSKHMKVIKVYYYRERLEATPLYINVTKLPAVVTTGVRIKNVGNLTAWVEGVEIKPGEEKVINKTLKIDAAGAYVVNVGGVAVPVMVSYYAANVLWKIGGQGDVEAVPGETYTAWLWIKNVGNATANLDIDGRAVTLKPQEEANISKAVTISAAGLYTVKFRISGDLNMTLYYGIRARVIAPRVEIVIWSPELRRSWPLPNSTDETSVSSIGKTLALTWGYVITTNATKRTVNLAVEDPEGVKYYSLSPGETIAKNFTTTVQAPGETTLEVKVNSTKYSLKTAVQLIPPKITVKDILKIEFEDSRKLLGLKISCRAGSVAADVVLDMLRVSGVLTYTQTGRAIYGDLTVNSARGISTGDYRGKIEGISGQLTLNIAGHNIYLEFTTAPLSLTRVLFDGAQYSCNVPTELVPPILYKDKPTAADEFATEYVYRLLSSFARTDSDRPQSIVWNGDYVEVIDKGGNLLRVYIRRGEIQIEGALTATIVISQ